MATATALTNAGRALITARLSATSGVTATLAPYMGFGTSSSATASATSTALGTEVVAGSGAGQIPSYARATVTGSQVTTSVTNDTYQAQATLNANGASSSVSIQEAGNFDASTAGNLMIYATFPSIGIIGSDTLTVKLQVQFN